MLWFSQRPFLWRAAFIVLALYSLAFEALVLPAMGREMFGMAGEAALAGLLAFGLVMVAMIFGLLFLLARAPVWLIRGAVAYAILAWSGFSFAIWIAGPVWSPVYALPGLFAGVLLVCLVADFLRKPDAS